MVSKCRTWFPLFAVSVLALGGGCVATVVGTVEPRDRGVALVSLDGDELGLRTPGAADPLSYLDGHLVEVRGPLMLGRLTVRDWKVLDGLNGFTVWVGTLERQGAQIGLTDRNSGAYVFVNEGSVGELSRYLGRPVLLEGYVEGAHRVRVVYFRVLAPDGL